jgi:hypothetical protein
MVSPTGLYIQNFNDQNNCTAVSQWMHDNPATVKALQVVGLVLGAAVLVSTPFILPVVACVVGIVGALFVIVAVVSWLFLKYVTCAKHEITQRFFQEAQCKGGHLYYRGNIPILELSGDDPGRAHGYLLGSYIYALKRNFDLAIHTLLGQPRAHQLPHVLGALKRQIPPAYLKEMEGLAEGYNQWAEEAAVETAMTLDDVLLMHLIPDSKHFHPRERERALANRGEIPDVLGNVACTTLLHRDPKNGLLFERNMDWCPFGDGGAASILIVWKDLGIAALGVPGLIGVLTGWSRNGLVAAMNVCPGETGEARGMPAILFNRCMLEEARSVQEVVGLTGRVRPLGPYHLTVADRQNNGACISFYQGPDEADHIRYVREEDELPLLVVNWRYPECRGGSFNSEERTELLTRYFRNALAAIPADQIEWRPLMENALQLTPLVNSWITMHSCGFAGDDVFLKWDNGYAAAMPPQRISMSALF